MMTAASRSFAAMLLLLMITGCSGTRVVEPGLAIGQQQCVVLLHGLWHSGWAMWGIESYLNEHGFMTEIVSYPSTSGTLQSHADDALSPGVARCQARVADGPVHIVTHSMGAIVARVWLQDHGLPRGSRLVMLSPPNQGSSLSTFFHDWTLFQWIAGPAAVGLAKGEAGEIDKLKPLTEEVGVIGAYRNWAIWPESVLPEPNDGTIALSDMVLPEMKDFVVVESGHSVMRYDDQVLRQIVLFLRDGQFQHVFSG